MLVVVVCVGEGGAMINISIKVFDFSMVMVNLVAEGIFSLCNTYWLQQSHTTMVVLWLAGGEVVVATTKL